jgi:hypothetical protein
MKTLKVKWTGLRPLVMHSSAMIDPDNACVRQMGELQRQLKKAKKDDTEGREKIRRMIERAEWEGSMYWGAQWGMYLPGKNIMATILSGARLAKCGKQAERGIVPIEDTPIKTKRSTLDLDKLFTDPEFQFRHDVRIPPKTGARLMKVRPVVPTGWVVEFVVEYDESTMPTVDLKEALISAGAMIGTGDWRPVYGRFIVNFSE